MFSIVKRKRLKKIITGSLQSVVEIHQVTLNAPFIDKLILRKNKNFFVVYY